METNAIRYKATCRDCGRDIVSYPVPATGALNGDHGERVRCSSCGTTNFTKQKRAVEP